MNKAWGIFLLALCSPLAQAGGTVAGAGAADVLAVAGGAAASSHWVPVYKNISFTLWVDRSALKRNDGQARVWEWVVFNQPQRLGTDTLWPWGGVNYSSFKALYNFDCQEGTIDTLGMVFYDAAGRPVTPADGDYFLGAGRYYAAPDSAGKVVQHYACRA